MTYKRFNITIYPNVYPNVWFNSYLPVSYLAITHIFTSTKYAYLYFLRKLIAIYSSVYNDRTETYTPRLSIGRNLYQP